MFKNVCYSAMVELSSSGFKYWLRKRLIHMNFKELPFVAIFSKLKHKLKKPNCFISISCLNVNDFFVSGDFINKYYFPVFVPIGVTGNILSFLVSKIQNSQIFKILCVNEELMFGLLFIFYFTVYITILF